ncbi:16S rRNA (adenine(1518)-N(6)/adenine(1519)-N(6))-dimethyltransferase RsmA [Jeongeupia naejangsanensis]|uniref:Ribosomal RNA small subunit methyltransferase A n=1 Tax=Jeongeupia naejangsanensis TaxID=613195 RepID=A0ABS2BNL1_9NEIS|nr:16S rRNA (adenine(1518)-N(6)/adenine(1519)-N(6))-dimethyltransferase RsmA [Jeongeupia naejangsanensis]MBM3117212.1 16S rRNA (adenine(1518)-N(6)/adenine(1519)-N(6))-dimethyltransferase RsmA [Jeongeupia naejangsanensis]
MSHIPRKRFGQNFLQDQGVIHGIIAAIDPRPGDVLVEIGPGLAALTEPLMQRAGRLHVVEIDRDIVSHLSARFSPEQLVIHNADALKFDFAALAADISPDATIRLAGNLPYNISTPLLFHLASFGPAISDMHFMLQKEVVDRMVAEPGTADYGRLSVMLQVRFNMDKVLDVPPTAFYPPPKVDSSVVRMMPWAANPWPVGDLDALEKLVTTAFGQRRKTIRNNLKGIADDAQLLAAGIEPGWRPENVTVGQYVSLANLLATR